MNHLVVPIGASHISSWLQEIQSREWEKKNKEQTSNKAWVKCKKIKLWHCIPCRLKLACISSKISTKLKECWLILTGLPSLLLDPISCRLVSSAVRCWVLTAPLRRPSPTASSGFLHPTPSRIPLPTSGHVEDRGLRPLFGFAPKQTKGSSA